jgi:uncharacterized protein
MLSPDAIEVVTDLNPWWADSSIVRPAPPTYRRRGIRDIETRLTSKGRLIEIVRGPRQVGKTTGIHQIIEDLLRTGTPSRDILFVRFDLEILREIPRALVTMTRWFSDSVRKQSLGSGVPPFVFFDEVHKLPRWDEQVKHLVDSFPVRVVLTGSSSVLVARGGRESLAGRSFSTEMPTFSFREVIEAWAPALARRLPEPIRLRDAVDASFVDVARRLHDLRPSLKTDLSRRLERYYHRGGYPRLHSGDVDDDIWADYLTQTVFESVLGVDIPDLFPVQDPRLLRHVYLSVARFTGREVSQPTLTDEANAAGFHTTQPTVGRYLHYLADALLIREFRRFPLAKSRSAKVPAKITLSDLGVRNAIFRGAPSLWESDPAMVGPLVETLVQSVVRDADVQVHFWRDYAVEGNRKSPTLEVDFVAERTDGATLPIEVKFRRKIDSADRRAMLAFLARFESPIGVVVTRDRFEWDAEARILMVPLLEFLLCF